jgi:K+/H+ antiporter YhaU regulatory subunit KhtT
MPAAEIERLSDSVRAEYYRPIEALSADAAVLRQLRRVRRALEIGWYTIGEGSALIGQSIGDGAIRQRTGALIIAVMRGQSVLSNPSPDTLLHSGDQIAVLGTAEQRTAFQALSEELLREPPATAAAEAAAPHAPPAPHAA